MTQPENSDWQQRYRASLMGVFGDPQELLVSGDGAWVTDSQGRQLLDMLGGIAVNALGHAHPAIVSALSEQAQTLGHISNLFTSEPQMRLAEMLIDAAEAPPGSTVFFANSGSEANEAALKAVLRHGQSTGRRRILALENGFHGRTVGALSLTHKPAYREPFGDLIGGVEFLAPNDLSALEAAFSDGDVAGIFCEPIQGEAGVMPLDDAYLTRVRELTRKHQALLVLDEVQTGVGRTGEWFRFQGVDADVVPDLMTLAKGLGAGVPIGAMIAFGHAPSTLMGAGMHGTTFGGNPLAAAAGATTLETIRKEGLMENARTVGARIAAALAGVDAVAEVRQYGLHIGLDLDPSSSVLSGIGAPAKELVTIARENHHMIINATGEHTLRLAPPLNLTTAEADAFLTRFTASLKDLPR
ncbi:MAG: acetylornithine transaminase [Nesterenkonia sp.]